MAMSDLSLSDNVKEHFFNPKNVGVLMDADVVGEVGALAGGDVFKLMLKIDATSQVITSARFQTFGCGAAIAASSAVTELVIGKTLGEAEALTNADIAAFLDGLPDDKMYCAVMAYEALRQALARYRGGPPEPVAGDAVLCRCFGVDAGMIERAVRANRLTLPDQVIAYTKAGGGCPTCFAQIEELVAAVNAAMVEEGSISAAQAYRIGSNDSRGLGRRPRPNGLAMTRPPSLPLPGTGVRQNLPRTLSGTSSAPDKLNLIKLAIEGLRPHLQRDGGDCELVDIDGNTVFVKLSGSCVGCQLASVTLSGVQDRLVEKLGVPLRVMPVQ
jgi:NifU-like protein